MQNVFPGKSGLNVVIPTDLELAVANQQKSSPLQRLEVVCRFYEDDVGVALERPLRDEDRERLAQWLLSRRKDNIETFAVPEQSQRKLISLGSFEKAWTIAQSRCAACEPLVGDESIAKSLILPINVEPWSAQSKKDRVLIRETVKAAMLLAGRASPIPSPNVFCITVVAVTPRRRPVKDVDNLVKGLLDSMSGVLYDDDQQIQCLTARRVLTNSNIGSYTVAAKVVYPYDADVIHDGSRPSVKILQPRIE